MIWLAAAAGYLLIHFILAFFLSRKAFFPRTYEYEQTYRKEIELGRFSEDYFSSLPGTEMRIDSGFGYDLNGIWIPSEGSGKVAVIVHGHTYTLFGSVKYIDVFRSRGYNVLIYDQPYHGRSGGSFSSVGYHEKDVLKSVIDRVCEEMKRSGISDPFILTHGESMGAATVLMHAAEDERVDAVVSDCPYSSLRAEFSHQLREYYRLPGLLLLPMLDLAARMRIGVPLRKVSPEKAAEKIDVPVLFFHGTDDRFVPMKQSIDIYRRKKDRKRLFLMPDAPHAASIVVNRKRYEDEVDSFLSDELLFGRRV